MSVAHIKRCLDIAEKDIVTAVETREACKLLLDHVSKIAAPNQGAPKLLLVLARMATTACDWVDGELRIEMVGDGEVTVVELMSELGGGMRERVLPSFSLNVPLAEFTRAVERVPHMIEPLTTKVASPRRVVFTASQDVRKSTIPPPPVEIGKGSLYDGPLGGTAPVILPSDAAPPPAAGRPPGPPKPPPLPARATQKK
jgi:hypothetical protein